MKHLVIAAFLACLTTLSMAADPANLKTKQSSTDYTATIEVEGLEQPFTVLQITDTHISVPDSSESQYRQYSARMDKAFPKREHYRTKKMGTPAEHFLELMTLAREQHVDLIILTGDIVNNPSHSSVRFVEAALKETGIPYLYVSGNHDWHYEGMKGSDDELRKTWSRKSLTPLYNGRPPLASAVDIHGVKFIAIDNSTYQVNAEQLAFFEREISAGVPSVLVHHIPLYVPGGEGGPGSCCGHPDWGWATDENYEIERRERWPETGNLQSTMDFLDAARNARNLVAILAGHTHRARTATFSSSAVEYVTAAGFSAAHRLITFVPYKP